jgi:hypothetical protein
MTYPYTLTDRTLSTIIGGRVYQTDRSNPGWDRIKEILNGTQDADDADLIALFAPIEMIQRNMKEITVRDGMIFWGDEQIHSSLARRMLDVISEGLDIEPWKKFATNVYANPSPMARTELYDFLEKADCPITPDGCFIGFKKVRYDYLDCHSGTFDNSVGQFVSMPREQVDPRRSNVCSTGLHFCSKKYLPNTPGERTLLVKINPRDVVSIPDDHDQAKGRTCQYEVVGEITPELAQTIVWSPIVAGHQEHRWGFDPSEPEVPTPAEPEEKPVMVEFVMSVSHGKITAKKFEKLLKKHGSQRAIAQALGLSTGTVQQWKARLLG